MRTADVNALALRERFDRVVSVEMFEHVRNYRVLFERVASWLRPRYGRTTLPLTVRMIEQPTTLLWWTIRADLAVVGLCSVALLAMIARDVGSRPA